MCEQQVLFWAQIFSAIATVTIALLTWKQSSSNTKMLKEMKTSRRSSYCPIINVIKDFSYSSPLPHANVFDNTEEIIRNEKRIKILSKDKKYTSSVYFLIKNCGTGVAIDLRFEKFNNYNIVDCEPIDLLEQNCEKNIVLIIEHNKGVKIPSVLTITYQNISQEKFQQEVMLNLTQNDFLKLEDAKDLTITKPKLVKE